MMKRRWIWTLAVAALFCSCSVSEDLEMEVPSAEDCILEVAVGLDDGEKTRGLSGDASSITATWQAGDKVLVYKGSTKVGELTPVSTGSASTTLRGKLSGTYDSYATGSTLTLYYNTTSTSFSSFTQDGTLATILANLRYQSATTTISKASDRPTLTGTAVTFNLATNNPSINHFTLNQAMKTLRVCVKGSSTILVSATAASPTTDFYVAIPAAASKTYYIEGVDARQSEYFQAKTAALSANKYYSASITLAEYPLTFEPVSATTTVTIPNSQGLTYQYSTNDGASWTSSSAASVAMSVSAGQRLMVRRLTGNCANGIGTITISQPCYVYGNVHSLFGFRNKLTGSFGKNGYIELFKHQTNLWNHGFRNICIVPVDGTNKADDMSNMFNSMFYGCSSLTTAPVLDFSNLNTSSVWGMSNMFRSMFYGCSSLTTAPVLDLSNWNTSGYMSSMFSSMFYGCSSLTTAPVLDFSNFDTSSVMAMDYMFNGMFSGCTSLTTAPDLYLYWDTPNVQYMNNMFNSMFYGCASLITAPVLDISNYSFSHDTNTEDMFSNMFSGCTSLTTGPVLDFSEWAVPSNGMGLYVMFKSMFDGCSSLNAVTMKLAITTILGETSRFTDFLTGAKTTGTLTVSSGTTSYWNAIKTAGYIPSGWTITEQ